MMKCKKRILAFLACVLLLASALPVSAFAAGTIDPEHEASMSISYVHGKQALAGAVFKIYKVADINEYAELTLTEKFSKYPVDLGKISGDEGNALAATLKGYIQRDNVSAEDEELTDVNGEFTAKLETGLYVVIGETLKIGDYIYTVNPFLTVLPVENAQDGSWDYNPVIEPKNFKEYEPDEPGDETITRRVLKIWDDEGYEELRPKEVTVQLLRDGKPYDTQVLNQSTNWRYEWTELDSKSEWTLVENEVKGYYTSVSLNEITFTVTNRYISPLAVEDPPVVKKLTGDTPTSKGTFTFRMTAESKDYPMPAGSSDGVKEVSVYGSGSTEFGEITFTEAGTYRYKISEVNTGLANYTYDTTVYTITYVVKNENGKLKVERTITETNGKNVDTPVFTNRYTKSDTPSKPKLPQTGVTWWPVPVLAVTGMALIFAGILRKKMSRDK